MSYEGVRFIVLSVAVQRDGIHKGLRNIFNKICTAPFELNKCECLTTKRLVWTFSLNSKQILPHLGLQHVNLRLNLAFLAKEKHK
jgi:hypothetical protein